MTTTRQSRLTSSPRSLSPQELENLVPGRGIGRSLMTALHDAARQRGRCLVVLGTRRGDPAERSYQRLGYREAGVIPGYTSDAAGARHDNASMYRQLSM